MLAAACLFPLNPAIALGSFTTFIGRSGDRLMDGMSEYRFIGTNAPFLERAWADPAEMEDEIRAASQSGINVIRLYPLEVRMSSDPPGTFRHVMGPGQFNESAFKSLDKVLELANRYGVRLIIPFVDRYNYVGGTADWAAFRGKSADSFWSDPVVKQDFKDFIRFVVLRTNTYTKVPYKDDKAILAWQLGNELTSTDSWTSEMAAYIKSLDGNHLVGDGGYVRAQGIRTNALNDPNIDFIDPHIYQYHNYPNPIAKLNEWKDTTRGKKPLIIGEFGDFSPDVTEELLNTVQNNGTSGAMIWGSMSHHRAGGWHWPPVGDWSYLRYPGLPSGDWANEAVIFNKLRSYAYSIKGLPVPSWPAPDAPILFPADSVHALSWFGVSGADSYDVERAPSPSGPWTVIDSGVTDDITAPDYLNYPVPIMDDTTAAEGTSYYYRVRSKNPDGLYSPYSNTIGPVTPRSVVVLDNADSGYSETGTWGDSPLPGSYNGGSRYSNTPGSTATWALNIPGPGYYNVYVRYPYYQNSTQTVTYTVYHDGTTDTVTVDQKTVAEGQWHLIDSAYFTAGNGNFVMLTAGPGSVTGNISRADAVMLEPVYFGDLFQSGGSSDWTALGGTWSVADDTGTKVLKQSGAGIAEARAGAVYADVSVTAAMKAYDNAAAGSASGVVARASADFSNLYMLRIHYALNRVQLYKKVNGAWTNLGEAELPASPGTWYLLRLELTGSKITGYVNGVPQISVTDASLTEGYAGLRTYDQTAVFDYFIVAPI